MNIRTGGITGVLLVPALLVIGSAVTALAQGQFTRVGARTNLTGASADGRIAVGSRGQRGPAWRWTAIGGLVDIGGDGFQAAISRDGQTIVSNAKDSSGISSAAIWQGRTEWKNLGGLKGGQVTDGALSTAFSVSADGSVVVGLAWLPEFRAHGFRWDARTGMIDLGSLQGEDSRANVISADGNVILGMDENARGLPTFLHDKMRGAMWWQGLERLIHPFGWVGLVTATNFNGTVWVGSGHPIAVRHAYRMTMFGSLLDLGALPRGLTPARRWEEDRSFATAVSDDGRVVAGDSGAAPTEAFIWTPETGMLSLRDYAVSLGITGLERWRLYGVGFVSPDGRILGGTGTNPDGLNEGWILKLP